MKKKKSLEGNRLFEGLLIGGEFISFYVAILWLCNYLANKGV